MAAPEYQPAQSLGYTAHEQNMSALAQLGNIAVRDAMTISKVVDYDHLENKRMVDLAEALGAREVASEVNPGGPRKPSA